MSEQKQLKDYQLDENIQMFALLKQADIRVTNSGKPYIAITIADRSMEISGMKWDASDEEFKVLEVGKVVFIKAVRQSYRDKPQLKFLEIRPAHEGEPQNVADFVPSGPMKALEMEEEVNTLIFKIINPTWQRIVRFLFNQYRDQFFTYPAAKSNHHAFAGGLGYHSLSIARLAQSVAQQYEQLDESLLLAGALLHDLGKVIELSGPIATTYTIPGNLIGHIVLIDEQIVLAAQELKLDLFSEDLILLRHVILAHHGQLEYGSPVRPLVQEANVLHQLDELDANLQSFDNVLNETEPGEFSNRSWALDNRSIYRPSEN
ncbi:HD domain-containing protein [Weissella coleopterorum]|uniref:HD domain-containing protein n=1 Tax=Weissella coleopterorum TaxID=2714949 RepID=A0A6G8AZI4_9LACO|nr:HD domain-containing protein [Weissella coleopterorum]QIL50478.1 HD domain-containing protein [Weissella coleopterorum]